uniref:Skp1_POZ domain-containing protein n=1 Tax=Steinernema glaseri TaxID=37863 RepID=A0A1I7YCU7_9BILA
MSTALRLTTADQKTVDVQQDILEMSELLKDLTLFHEADSNEAIPMENIDSGTLEIMEKYCQLAKNLPEDENESLSMLDQFFATYEREALFRLVMAADFLHMQQLYDRCCAAIYNLFIHKQSADEIRRNFNLDES